MRALPAGTRRGRFHDAFGFLPPNLGPDAIYDDQTSVMISWIDRGDYQGGAALAKKILSTMGIAVDEESEQFRWLSLEMLKLQVTLREFAQAPCARRFSRRAAVSE